MDTILIVDDDAAICSAIKQLLCNRYRVLDCGGMEQALGLLNTDQIDLFLLDVNLPSKNGFLLCEEIRKQTRAPIIFITVQSDEESLIRGLSCGGDDYIIKPFSFKELESRIMAQLRRYHYSDENTGTRITCGRYVLFLDAHKVTIGDTPISLTGTEFEILKMLMSQKGCLVTRQMLLSKIWDIHENFVEDNTLTVNISRLRKKLSVYDDAAPIETISGIGYRWKG